MNLGQQTVDRVLSRNASYQNDRIAFERGWKNPNYFIMDQVIVISVKTGVNLNPQYSSSIPQFSINGRTIGRDESFGDAPEKDIPIWYAPLFPNGIVVVPEIGEIVAVLRETTSSESNGYWIGRVSDTDDISLHLAKSQMPLNQSPQEKYGMPFDVKKVHDRSRQPTASDGRKRKQLPAKLGDVVMQGRNGSFLRHSYNPNYGAFTKPAVLEMGILNNKEVYRVSGNPSVGATKTKTLHLADSRPADLGRRAQKLTPLENDFTVLPAGSLIDTPTGPRQAGNVPVQNVRNIIANYAEEFYNISTTQDSEEAMHRLVLGEKLNDSLLQQDDLIITLIDSIRQFAGTVETLFDSFLNHTHAIPEINIDIPDKTVEDLQIINRGSRLIPQPPTSVFVPSQNVQLPPTGATEVTVRVEPANAAPFDEVVKVGGKPGEIVKVPAKFIKVPSPPRLQNLGYRPQTIKREIKFDDISIGGNANPRFTVPIQTDRQTTRINTDLNDLQDSFSESKDKFIELTNLLESHLSKRHYIN